MNALIGSGRLIMKKTRRKFCKLAGLSAKLIRGCLPHFGGHVGLGEQWLNKRLRLRHSAGKHCRFVQLSETMRS